MIVKGYWNTRNDGVKLYRVYSDIGADLKQVETGAVYADVIDVENAPYTYEEIPDGTEITDEEALDILMGGDGV